MEAAPPGRAFRETRPSPLLAAHWPDRVVCPHPAPTPSCREAGKWARCRPQRRWGQWAGHELALNALVTLSQTKPSVSALTRELRSLSKCGLSSYDAPGPRDTGTGAWPAVPCCQGALSPQTGDCRPSCPRRPSGWERRGTWLSRLAAPPAGTRAEGRQGQGQGQGAGAERPLGRGPRVFRGKPCAQRGASTSQQGAGPPPGFVWPWAFLSGRVWSPFSHPQMCAEAESPAKSAKQQLS